MLIAVLLLAVKISIRTAIIMVMLVAGLRLSGKRQLGQFNIYDLAMIMLIANAVQNSMTAGLGNLTVGIASSGTLTLLGVGLTYIIARKPVLSHLITGSPTVLVSRGQVMPRNMRKEAISMEQLLAAARQHEIKDISQIQLAVLEVDGDISIVTTQ